MSLYMARRTRTNYKGVVIVSDEMPAVAPHRNK